MFHNQKSGFTRLNAALLCFGMLAGTTGCAHSHGERVKVCEYAKDIMHTCYDRTTEYLACESLHTEVKARLTKFSVDRDITLTEGEKESYASMCSSGCDARKSGYSWSSVDQELDCEQLASAQ